MSVHHIEELRCRGLNQHGQGVASLADGLTVFVNGLIPGELARVKVITRKKSYAIGKIIKLLKPSPQRCEAPCPVFGRCGGCTLQHIKYEAQLLFKADRVRDAFVRIGGFSVDAIERLLPQGSLANATEPPWHYRAKSQMPIQSDAGRAAIGFYALGTHDVVDNDACLIQEQSADLVRGVLRDCLEKQTVSIYDEQSGQGLLRHVIVRTGFSSKDVLVVLVINMRASEYAYEEKDSSIKQFIQAFMNECKDVLSSHGYNLSSVSVNHNTRSGNTITGQDFSSYYFSHDLEERILGLSYRISPAAFFQVNPRQTEDLYSAVLKAANLNGQERTFDLYCGTGSISLQLARFAKSVKACETVAPAIEDAKRNAELNQISNVEFHVGKAEHLVPQWIQAGEHADVIVVDPPRKGLDASLVETLRLSKAERIVYVSCDPATLARDCKLLCAEGLYALRSIEAFDMFPHSMHVECVCLLSRK